MSTTDSSWGFAPPVPGSARQIRQWWHQILGHYDRYPTFAMMVALPGDTEAIRYLREYGRELHLISGDNCLVLTLLTLGFTRHDCFDDEFMTLANEENVAEGYCRRVTELFGISFLQTPYLLLFRDIREPEHILVGLKGMETEEILQEMRDVFSVIDEAVKEERDPLRALEVYNKREALGEKRKAARRQIESFTGKTLEKVMEAFIKSIIS